MKLKSISIRPTQNYEKARHGEYVATAEIEGGDYSDSIKVTIDPERASQIVEIMAGAVAESMSRAASQFSQELQARIAGPAIEADALAAPSAEPTI